MSDLITSEKLQTRASLVRGKLMDALPAGASSSAHEILCYLQKLDRLPALRSNGVPTLF